MTNATTDQLAIPETVTALLDGADPDTYVVIPASALCTQVSIALAETLTHDGRGQPGRAAARLIRSLMALGFTVSTSHPRADQ